VKRVQNPKLWSRAPAFSIPLMDVFSVLRVNLVGREPRGRIRPGEEYRRYLDAFTEEISQLTNVESGEPAVERIYRADHHADPLTIGSEPDLIVWWRKEHPIRAIRSRTLGTISGEGAEIRTGEHVMRGMLLLSHPQAKPGRHTIPGMNVLDIAATLCDLAGIQPGITLDGTSRRRDLLAE
jgi:predicted AlkP superfamily phosphohydrolase/phosphomutase